MSLGPVIASDGLVLALDAANIKSFRGEPTTNVVTNAQPAAGWNTANAQGSSITRSFLTEDGIPFMRFDNVVNGSDYPRVTDSVFANSATITGTFSTSLEARGTPDAQLRLRIYENGSTKITNTITLTDKWVRYKFENQTTGFALNQPYFNPVTTGATYDIRNIQIEAKPSATRFVDGTRGTTVATGGGWADLSGNAYHGEILNGTTTSNDNTSLGALDFDGIDDSVNLGNQADLAFTNGVFSVETWVYYPSSWTGGSQYPNLVSKGAKAGWDTDGWSLFGFRGRGTGTGYSVGIGLRNSGVTNIREVQDLTADTWLHAVGTLDGSNIKIYINGNQELSNSQTINPASNSSDVLIGRDSNVQYFPGKIAKVKIYNKALTASEVLNNFNATKGRFGL